jgi:glycosyltransferase involved in cell wall biosynthesis
MELNDQPLISVVIPTYNRTSFLKLTLESVLHQTYQNFEIIVVDDGTSNDENLFLCNTFEKVRYIKIENSGGPAKPRNVGIREAKGKYMAFVDDDDLWLPQKLKIQVAILNNNPSFGLVHSCCELIDEKGILKNVLIGRPGSPDVKHGDVSLRMMGNWTLMTSSVIIRKEVLEKVGIFNEEMPAAGEDVEFWVRCSFETKFYYIDESLAQYRVHSGNISGNSAKYIELPLYLKRVFTEVYVKGKISKRDYERCIYNLCQMQLKMIQFNFFKTIKYVFELNAFWFLKRNNNKLLIKMLFFK